MTFLTHEQQVAATTQALEQERCVLFVGAGVSMSPNAGLPNWHSLRDWTLQAVAGRFPALNSLLPKLTSMDMIGSPGRKGMTPELVASVISRMCEGYFHSLGVLNDGSPNENHRAIALLAKLGRIRYIVTTNFDLFIEKALEQEHVEFDVYRTDEEFSSFPLGSDFIPTRLCLLKIHGCLSQPQTIIATVEKQAKGLSDHRLMVLKWLQSHYHLIFWGYSGWDLKINIDYLGTVSVAPRSPGFIWSLYRDTNYVEAPSPYILELERIYGGKGIVGHTVATDAISNILLSNGISLPETVSYSPTEYADWVEAKNQTLVNGLQQWAAKEVRPEAAVKIFGDLLLLSGFHEDAIACYNELLQVGQQTKDWSLLGWGLQWLGGVYQEIGNLPKTLDCYRQMEQIARSTDDMEMLASVLGSKSVVLLNLGHPQQALSSCQEARRIFNVSQDSYELAHLTENLGMIYDSQRQYEAALQMFRLAEQAYRNAGAKQPLCSCLNRQGIIYRNWSEFENADRCFRESLAIAKEILGNRRNVEEARLFLASVRLLRGDPDLVDLDIREIETYARETRLPDLQAKALQYLIVIEHNHGHHAIAEKLETDLIQIHREQGNPRLLGTALLNQSLQHLRHDQIEQALRTCEEAIQLLHDVGDLLGLAIAYQRMGDIYQEHLSRPDEAIQYYLQSISTHRNVDHNPKQFIPSLLRQIALCRNRIRKHPTNAVDEILLRMPLIEDVLQVIYAKTEDTKWHEQIIESMTDDDDFEGPLYTLAQHLQTLGHESLSDSTKSLQYLQAAFEFAVAIDYSHLQANLLCDIGWQHIRLEEFELGIPLLQQAVQMSHALADTDSEILHTGNLGFGLARAGQNEAGFVALEEALRLARDTNHRARLLWLLRELASYYKERRDIRSLPYLKEAISLVEEEGNLQLLMELSADAGKIYYDAGDFEQSLQYRLYAVHLLETTSNDHVELALRLATIAALCETKLERILQAIDYYDRSLSYCYKVNSLEAILRILPLRSRAVDALKDPSDLPHPLYDLLLEHFRNVEMTNMALALEAQKGGFPQPAFEPKLFSRILNSGQSTARAWGTVIVTFAVYLQSQSQFSLADEKLKVAEMTALAIGDKQWLASIRRNRADLLVACGYYDESMESYKDAQSIAQLAENMLEVELISYKMADIELKRKRYEEALRHIQDAITAAQSAGYEIGVAHDQAKMAEILEEQGALEEAVKALKDAISIFYKWTQLQSPLIGASLSLARVMNKLRRPLEALELIQGIEPFVNAIGSNEARSLFKDELNRAHHILGE